MFGSKRGSPLRSPVIGSNTLKIESGVRATGAMRSVPLLCCRWNSRIDHGLASAISLVRTWLSALPFTPLGFAPRAANLSVTLTSSWLNSTLMSRGTSLPFFFTHATSWNSFAHAVRLC